ncbi:MAG: hypothetical protein WCS65_12570 [Verrucomicrobiae bacterium]
MFRYGLSWPEARSLLSAGAYVRRELWTDKRLFLTPGGLVWVDASPARVVQAEDFGRGEFLARDWTDMGFDQGGCIDNPGWTEIAIDETGNVIYREYVPASSVQNPPSWGRFFNGRAYESRRIVDRATGGMLWVHPITGATEPVTYTVTPEVPASGTGPTVILSRSIVNPFAAACRVSISGAAVDALMVAGVAVALPTSFSLAAGAAFALAVLVRNPRVQPRASLDIVVTFSI